MIFESRMCMNQKKADWRDFRGFINRRFNDLPIPSNVLKEEVSCAKPSKQRSLIAYLQYECGRIFSAEATLADKCDEIRNENLDNPAKFRFQQVGI